MEWRRRLQLIQHYIDIYCMVPIFLMLLEIDTKKQRVNYKNSLRWEHVFPHPGLALGSLLPSFLGSIRLCVCVKSHVCHLNHLQFQCSLLVIWHCYGIWPIGRWFAYWRCWVSSSQTIKLQVNHLRFWSIWVLSFSRWKLPTITRLCKKCCKFSHPRSCVPAEWQS